VSDLRKAAQDFESHVKTARVAPHMPEDVYKLLKDLHKKVQEVGKVAQAVKKTADAAYDDAVETEEKTKAEWLTGGDGPRHPDGFNSTDEGSQLEGAVELTERLYYREFDGGGQTLGGLIQNLDETVEWYMKWMEKGRY